MILIVLLPLNLEEEANKNCRCHLGTVLMHYSQWSTIGFYFRLLIWFRLTNLLGTYQHVYRSDEHCKMRTALAFDLDAGSSLSGPATLWEGLKFQSSKKKKKKNGVEKASYMFTGHTAFLKLLCNFYRKVSSYLFHLKRSLKTQGRGSNRLKT